MAWVFDDDETTRPGHYMGITRSTTPIFSSRVPTTSGALTRELVQTWRQEYDTDFIMDPDMEMDIGL